MASVLNPLNSRDVKKLKLMLKEEFDFNEDLDFQFFVNNRKKVFMISKKISDIDVSKLRLDSAGLYFGQYVNDTFRLSIEGSQLIGKHAKKNIIELNSDELELWLKGEDLSVSSDIYGFCIVKYEGDFYGCGKISNNVLYNFVPKARRMKNII